MPKNISKQEFRDLRVKLKLIAAKSTLSCSQQFNESMSLITGFLDQLREQVTTVAFRDQLEEIYFFKFEKPEYYSLKIFEVARFTLVNQKPKGTPEMLRRYFMDELMFVARFFRQYGFYYEYFRSGFTELDDTLFLRGSMVQPALLAEVPELDSDFCTSGDYLFAKFMAYELLQDYILEELKQLDSQEPVVMQLGAAGAKRWLDWTGEVVNLVELGYALYVSRQMNEGKASLSEIFRWLEESFGVEIGIPANRFREIKRRKRITRTHFLDLLKVDLLRYMDKDEG